MFLGCLVLLVSVWGVHGVVFTSGETSQLESVVSAWMNCQQVPGLSIAIVKGSEQWTRGFGVADRETGDAVTIDHLFGIGSLTKAFTSTLLAMYLNKTDGPNFKTKVKDILGEDFAFIDDYRTRETTLRDVLIHRTGLSTGGLALFRGFNMSYTSTEYTKRFRFLPEVWPFRDEFHYNNFVYALAGRMVEVLSGETYEATLEKRIFKPLGMTNTRILGHTVSTQDPVMAKPYQLVDSQLQLSDPVIYNIHPNEAAGSIASSAGDMVKWMRFLLKGGKTETNESLVDHDLLQEAMKVHMAVPDTTMYRPTFPVSEVQRGYGYGWGAAEYGGHRKVSHAGILNSYNSRLLLYPDMDTAVFLAVNGPGVITNPVGKVLGYYLSDLALRETPWLNESTICTFPSPWRQTSPPPVPPNYVTNDDVTCIKCYVGNYGHRFFGDVIIDVIPGTDSLMFAYGHLKGSLNSTADKTKFQIDLWEPYRQLSHSGDETVLLDVVFKKLEGGKYTEVNLVTLTPLVFTRGVDFSDDIVIAKPNGPTVPVSTCGQSRETLNYLVFIMFTLGLMF